MRIALDLDDVLADLIGGLIQVHAETNGRRLSRCEAVDWSVFPDAVHEHMLENGGYACLAPREGAAEFLPWIAREHDVFIVTYRREEARALTRSWLASHFPGVCPPLFFAGGPKVEICRRERAEVIVDDSHIHLPQVVDALRIPGVLMDSPMNLHIPDSPRVRRVHNLKQARTVIEWLDAHGSRTPLTHMPPVADCEARTRP